MPRTKRPTKKDKKSLDGGEKADILKKFDKLVEEQKAKIDMRSQMELRNIELAFMILRDNMNQKYLNMTVGELRSTMHINEVSTIVRPASHDDGYITENSSQGSGERGLKKRMAPPTSASRSTTMSRRSRSADASARKIAPPSAARANQHGRSRSVYRTPAYNKRPNIMLYPPITPKVAPETPLTVLRQPRAGEMVVSMTGSPVMVPTYSSLQSEQKVNCNIMLNDGTMLSLQPRELRQSSTYIPFSLLGPGVLEQMKTIQKNLDKVVKLGEQHALN